MLALSKFEMQKYLKEMSSKKSSIKIHKNITNAKLVFGKVMRKSEK